MKRILCSVILLLSAVSVSFAQNAIKVEAPNVVAVDEQFNVTFIIEAEKNPSDFSWSAGDDFQLVWGPQKGSSTSIQIINGKRSTSHQTTFTYILLPKSKGTFTIPAASATLDGERISSSPTSIQVVTDASSGAAQSSGGSQGGSSQSSGSSSQGAVTSGEISGSDLFLRLSLSRSEVVMGEPITATLKLYQRVNIAGFENAKFPTFNGFWSQETYSPTNIEFKRESFDDKIYNTAVLRSYVLIPQQSGTITIDPAELVCLVNVRVNSTSTGSIFDSFFQDDYRTIRKRVTTNSVRVKVNPLPAGQPASFGGGVGSYTISSRLTSNELKTHDAASLVVTVSGRGNVSLLEAPKVSFPPDFEVYDTKTTENTDKSTGGTSGSKSFEYPFIPRSHGDFTIPSIEYSYYDVNSGQYVTLRTEPMDIKVAKGKGSDASSGQMSSVPSVERRGVQNLANDIRYISTRKPSLKKQGHFFLGSPLFWALLALILAGAAALYLAARKMAERKADVAGTRNRRATKMALGRLKQAGEFLDKNLYTAFYEELHKALLGYVSDKLNMDMTEINKDNIAAALTEGGASEEQARKFTDLLDACEFARYSPDAGHDAMRSHFDGAVEAISSIDSSLRNTSSKKKTGAANVFVALLAAGFGLGMLGSVEASAQQDAPLTLNVSPRQDTASTYSPTFETRDTVPVTVARDTITGDAQTLWATGLQAFNEERYSDASAYWSAILDSGEESASLYYNIGNAFFKQGNYPRAILNYERALKLDPSYSDARYNLEFSSTLVQDKIEPVPEFILKSFARKVCYLLGSNAWAWMFLALLCLALLSFVTFLLASSAGKRRLGFYAGIVLLLLSFCALWFSAWQKSDYRKSDSAIVMTPVVSVKGSPSEGMSKDLFVLHEGTKVTILDEVGDWKNISLADGRQGWIPSSDIEVI